MLTEPPLDPTPNPISGTRIVLGFMLAPIVPALLFAMLLAAEGGALVANPLSFPMLLGVGVVVGYSSAMMFGVPAYFVIRAWVRPSLAVVMAAGGVVAALPWILIALAVPLPHFSSVNDMPTVIDGARTTWGWLSTGRIVGLTFVLGALAGAFFWFIVRAGLRTPLPAPTRP